MSAVTSVAASTLSLRRSAAHLLPSPTATPVATATVLALLVSAFLLRTHPGDVDSVVAWSSTNVHNLGQHPVAAMVVSTFVVPGSLFPNLIVVAVGLAVLERAIGAGRTLLVALSGQVFATLLTEYGADLGARLHLFAESSADRSDVGVSYVMYAVLAASLLLLTGRARLIALAAVCADVVAAVLVSPDMTSAGHVLSVALGATTMVLVRRQATGRRAKFRNGCAA